LSIRNVPCINLLDLLCFATTIFGIWVMALSYDKMELLCSRTQEKKFKINHIHAHTGKQVDKIRKKNQLMTETCLGCETTF